ncbi:hypothetical protein TNCV_2989331 [Trichonephila clavipes]|nr:hypothetical protein TNCV_2989331 [Trichonephila clavipes]
MGCLLAIKPLQAREVPKCEIHFSGGSIQWSISMQKTLELIYNSGTRQEAKLSTLGISYMHAYDFRIQKIYRLQLGSNPQP